MNWMQSTRDSDGCSFGLTPGALRWSHMDTSGKRITFITQRGGANIILLSRAGLLSVVSAMPGSKHTLPKLGDSAYPATSSEVRHG